MRVLVLGGTGSIGGAIVQVLQEHGHQVIGLGRSRDARAQLQDAGATPIGGNLTDPMQWIGIVDSVDAVIQAAAVWEDEIGDIDRRVVDALLQRMQRNNSPKAFIYTGGCWLYGETADTVATEKTPFDPLASFAWAIPTMDLVLSSPHIRGMVIHPGMVYERNGGVFEHIFKDAKQLGQVRVIGNENIRWPLVHRMDLAELYVLMLQRGKPGDVYNGVAINGITIGEITRTIAKRLGMTADPVVCDVETAKSEFGSWAEGYVLDQQISGEKAKVQLDWVPKHTNVIADIA